MSPRSCRTGGRGASAIFLSLFLGSTLLHPRSAANAEVPLGGYVQGGWSVRASGATTPPGMEKEIMRAEARVQLRLEPSSAGGRAGGLARVDLIHDSLDLESGVDVRELYGEITGAHASVRGGRQVVTWGLGDLLFVNDVFPKDWNAFLTGAPLEYLKKGSDAIRVGVYPPSATLEVVVTPVFEPDESPDPSRLFYWDPLAMVTTRTTVLPERELGNMPIAARAYRLMGSHEVALYASRGFWGLPAAEPDNLLAPTSLQLHYPRLSTWGASFQGPLLSGVYSLEGGFYNSRDDQDGDDPLIENSQARYLAAYQFQPWSEATLAFQLYGEAMSDYDAYRDSLPAGYRVHDRVRTVTGFRLRQTLSHQTITLGLFLLVSPSDKDGYGSPSVRYQVTDELWAELGANIFEGKYDDTTYGQFEKNTHLYLTSRYAF